jgi:mRNA interferase MazF
MASTDPRRGEVWLTSLGAARKGEPGKNRPAIVISVDELSAGLEEELIVVVPVSSSRAPSPLRPQLSLDDGLERDSVAVCRAIRAVARQRMLRPVGKVRKDTLREIERSLGLILGIEQRD